MFVFCDYGPAAAWAACRSRHHQLQVPVQGGGLWGCPPSWPAGADWNIMVGGWILMFSSHNKSLVCFSEENSTHSEGLCFGGLQALPQSTL